MLFNKNQWCMCLEHWHWWSYFCILGCSSVKSSCLVCSMTQEPGCLTFITSCSGSSLPFYLIRIKVSQAKALRRLHTKVYVASESAVNPLISVGIVCRKDIQWMKNGCESDTSELGNATKSWDFKVTQFFLCSLDVSCVPNASLDHCTTIIFLLVALKSQRVRQYLL